MNTNNQDNGIHEKDTIFVGNDDQKNLVSSKLTKFCSLCSVWVDIWKIWFVQINSAEIDISDLLVCDLP